MTREDFQTIPITDRYRYYVQTKSLDIVYYTLSRLSGIQYSELRTKVQVQPYVIRDYIYLTGNPQLIIELNEAFSKAQISILETNSANASTAQSRVPLRQMFAQSI